MRIVVRSLLLLLVVLSTIYASRRNAFGVGAPPPSLLLATGIVIDESGRPVDGVVVAVRDSIASYIGPMERLGAMRDAYRANRKTLDRIEGTCPNLVAFTDSSGKYCVQLSRDIEDMAFYKPGYRMGRMTYPLDVQPDSSACSCSMKDLKLVRQLDLNYVPR